MYYQHEVESLVIGYAIEDKHGLYCEMPRTCTVWGRYEYSDTTYDKRYHSACDTEVCRSRETEEREVIVQEIARPDGYRVEDEQWDVLYSAKRHNALYYTVERGFHLIVER